MTELSYWRSNGDGACYTDLQFRNLHKTFWRDGVLPALTPETAGLLACTVGTASVTIANGAAVVDGVFYVNTTPVTIPIPAQLADSGFIIFLRNDWSAGTVRLGYSISPNITAIPAYTQTATVLWETPIFTGIVDKNGKIWRDATKSVAGVTDLRTIQTIGNVTVGDFTVYDGNFPLAVERSRSGLINSKIKAGRVSMTIPAGQNSATVGINFNTFYPSSSTFPSNTYAVTFSVEVAAGFTGELPRASAKNSTTTGFTIFLRRAAATPALTVTVHWIAWGA